MSKDKSKDRPPAPQPVTFRHDPATGLVELSNPSTPGGLSLVNTPKVTVTEDIIVAMAMRIQSCWLDQRHMVDWRSFVQPPQVDEVPPDIGLVERKH